MSKIIYKRGNKAMSTKEFIDRARTVHQNKYDYSKVIYKNNCTKVIIICPIHGEFKQSPASHSAGQGCPNCAVLAQTKQRTSSTAEFVKKAQKINGNRYDYSKVVYKNNHTKVKIICPEHGEFKQSPASHLKRHGCPVCARKKQELTTREFVRRSKNTHGSKYNYTKAKYINYKTKITIICPEHGEFLQTPIRHMRGQGCPDCANKNRMIDRSGDTHPGFLYFLTCKLGNDYFCKIGTAYDTKKRFRLFPFEIIDSIIIPGIIGPLSIIEEKIKKDFEEHRYIPKVRFAGGKKECFQIEAYSKINLILESTLKIR